MLINKFYYMYINDCIFILLIRAIIFVEIKNWFYVQN